MKKLFFFPLLCMSLAFVSCSSDEPILNGGSTEPSIRQVAVSFDLSTDKEFSSLKSVAPSLAGVKSMVYLAFRDQDQTNAKFKTFNSGDLSSIKDTLPEGKYTIVILASTANDFSRKYSSQIDQIRYPNNSSKTTFENWAHVAYSPNFEIFSKVFELNVVEGVNSQPIVLSRITSKIEIIPEDVSFIPTNVDSVTFHLNGVGAQYYAFKSDNFGIGALNLLDHPTSLEYSKTYTKEELKAVNASNPISLFVYPITSPFKYNAGGDSIGQITATIYKSGSATKDKTLMTTYALDRNKILRLSGNLFVSNPVVDGTVTVDNEWDAKIVEDVFDK